MSRKVCKRTLIRSMERHGSNQCWFNKERKAIVICTLIASALNQHPPVTMWHSAVPRSMNTQGSGGRGFEPAGGKGWGHLRTRVWDNPLIGWGQPPRFFVGFGTPLVNKWEGHPICFQWGSIGCHPSWFTIYFIYIYLLQIKSSYGPCHLVPT